MSRRTAEAAKAIRQAWEKEQELVQEGKGTRDWTPEQQQSIIEKGKAYDDNGKAFEGHHMKSAEANPDYQGNPLNIQFLTREEHRQAHDGDFHNPTNGYFDPITGSTMTFGDEGFMPCRVITLSAPCKEAQVTLVDDSSVPGVQSQTPLDAAPQAPQVQQTSDSFPPQAPYVNHSNLQKESWKKRLWRKAVSTFKSGVGWAQENPEKVILIVGAFAKGFHDVATHNRSHESNNSTGLRQSTNDPVPPSPTISPEVKPKITHASPVEHTVSGYDRRVNTKQGPITQHIDEYTRGGNKKG